MSEVKPDFEYFKNRNGQALRCSVNHSAERSHTLIILHGHGEHIGRYEKFKENLQMLPLNIATFDMRGYGLSEGREVYVDSLEDFIGDVTDFILFLKTEYRMNKPMILFGHSLGGLIAYHWAIRHSKWIDGLILSSPCLGLNLPKPLLWLNHAINAINPHFIYKNPVYPPYLTHNLKEVEKYKSDQLIKRKISARLLSEMIKYANEVKTESQIAVPFAFYILYAGLEKVVDKSKTHILYDKILADKKGIQEFEGLYHEIFNELEQDKVFDRLKEFLNEIITNS